MDANGKKIIQGKMKVKPRCETKVKQVNKGRPTHNSLHGIS